MILAETTKVIDFLRAPTPRLHQIIQDNQAAICGVTLAEVYAGAKSPADIARFTTALNLFGNVGIPETIGVCSGTTCPHSEFMASPCRSQTR